MGTGTRDCGVSIPVAIEAPGGAKDPMSGGGIIGERSKGSPGRQAQAFIGRIQSTSISRLSLVYRYQSALTKSIPLNLISSGCPDK